MTTHDRLTAGGSARGVRGASAPHPRRVRGDEAQLRQVRGCVFADGVRRGPGGSGGDPGQHVVGFVSGLTGRYRPGTVELAASALRSFFRFLRAEGLREDRLEDAVPMVPRRPAGLVRHLDPGRLEQLIASLDSVLAPRAAGPGDHLVRGPAGAAGQRGRAAAAGGPRLAQRRGAGACPQDRSWCAAAADRAGGSGAGRLPAARPPGHPGA